MSSSPPAPRTSPLPSVLTSLPVLPLHLSTAPTALAVLHHPAPLLAATRSVQPSAFTAVQSLAAAAPSAPPPPPPRHRHHPHVVPLSSATSSQAVTSSAFAPPVRALGPAAASTTAGRLPPSAAATPPYPVRAQSGPGQTTPFPRVVAGGRPTSTSASSSSSSSSSPLVSLALLPRAASHPQPSLASTAPPPPAVLLTPVKTSHDKENQPPFAAAGASTSPSTPLSLQSSARLLLTLDDEDMYSKVKRRSTVLRPIFNHSRPRPPTPDRTPAAATTQLTLSGATDPIPALLVLQPSSTSLALPIVTSSPTVEQGSSDVRRSAAKKKKAGRALPQSKGKEEREVQRAELEQPSQPRQLRSAARRKRTRGRREVSSSSEEEQPSPVRPQEAEQRIPHQRRRRSSSRRSRSRSRARKPPSSTSPNEEASSSSDSEVEEEKAADKKRSRRRRRPPTAAAAAASPSPSPSPSPSASPSSSPAPSPALPPLPPVPFVLPIPSLPYLPPVLGSSLSALSSTFASSPFSADFHRRLLSSSSSLSLRRYILCTPASLISRVRFILHRDRSSQKALAKCIGLSPATLSPLLNGLWLTLKLTYFTKMRVWAAQQDVRALMHTIERMRLWGIDERELMSRCGLTEQQLSRWLLFDTSMEERSRIDHAVEGFIRQCQQSVEGLLLSSVLSRFEADYDAVRSAGELDDVNPTVLTSLTTQEQEQLPLHVAGLHLRDDPPVQPIVFSSIDAHLAPPARAKRAPRIQLTAPPINAAVQRDSADEGVSQRASRGDGKEEEEERSAGSDAEGGVHVKREDIAKMPSPVYAAEAQSGGGRRRPRAKREPDASLLSPSSSVGVKRIRLTTAPQFDLRDDDVVPLLPSLPSPSPQLSTPQSDDPRSGVDLTRLRSPHLTGLSPPSATRWSPRLTTPRTAHMRGGRGGGGTFFYFDPDADMAQVVERWGLPPLSSLPTFSVASPVPSIDPAHLRDASTGTPLTQPPSIASSSSSPSAMLCTPAASVRRESAADLSLSRLFTPSALFCIDGPDSARKEGATALNVSLASSSDPQPMSTTPLPSSADVSAASDAPSSISGASSSPPTLATASLYSTSTPLTFVRGSLSSTSPSSAGMDPPLVRALDLTEGEDSGKQGRAVASGKEVDHSHEWADVMRSLSETPSSRR